ncbi:MAG: coproporphyrinogen III oxidase, partial [Candidatus Omnitrophota bacterium]
LVGARNYLQKKGYRHYELLNYAKAGFESRHNNIYWVNGQYLGLGPSAYSYIEGRRYRLAKDFEQYLEKAALGCLKPCEEETLGESERLQESFLLALRLVEGAKIKRFIDFLQQRKQTLERLEKNGLIRVQGGFVRLTAKGQLFAESVFVEFVGDGR